MLKGGTRQYEGLEEAVYANIAACKELQAICKSSFGPEGFKKLIVTHLGNLIVTKNAIQMTTELEVKHPAAKILVMAASNQAIEYGDNTNYVIIIGGQLLIEAENLLKQGIVVQDIVDGYKNSFNYIKDHIKNFYIKNPSENLTQEQFLKKVLTPIISTKIQYDIETITDLVIKAVESELQAQQIKDLKLQQTQFDKNIQQEKISIFGQKTEKKSSNPLSKFNPSNVRIAKIPGSTVSNSILIHGHCLPSEPKSQKTSGQKLQVAAFAVPLELAETETKQTLKISADQFASSESDMEQMYSKLVQSWYDAGVRLIATQYSINPLFLHYADKLGMIIVRINSKFEIRRFCLSCNAQLFNMCLTPDDIAQSLPEWRNNLGYIEKCDFTQIGAQKFIIFTNDETSVIQTIILRAATQSLLDDLALAVGNALNVVKEAAGDFVQGQGKFEESISKEIAELGNKDQGLTQYSEVAFAKAIQVVRELLQDLDNDEDNTIIDNAEVKLYALEQALNACLDILRVDQIVMKKQAGGPKPKTPGQQQWN